MDNCTNWFHLCLALCGVNLAMLAMFFNYTLKLKDKQIELKKEVREVERVNGKEKADIKELQNKVSNLESKLKNHDRK
ncbi:MAG: Lipopolysaccharide assembly protein A [Mycoplasmataceae bacterium]|nr:MAG: Lipopolysaccharide assembly protein A [Mycoplasmataceae bacterium]